MAKAADTRLSILQHSFDLIYKKGFQATSIDDIIATTRVTKGAFFYHFKNKEEMGLAMIREIMYPAMQDAIMKPLQNAADAGAEIYKMMYSLLMKNPFFNVAYGCPVINLVEEMAPMNTLFKQALSELVVEWQKAISFAILRSQASGKIRKEINARHVALFITTSYGGVRNMGKVLGKTCYKSFLSELKNYINNLA